MRGFARAVAVVPLLAVAACMPQVWERPPPPTPIAHGPQTEGQIERALQRYSGLIAAMDANGVAAMYTSDGIWERTNGRLHGRDAIRQAVASTNVRIVSNEMATQYLSYNGPAVVQTGEFRQSARLGDGRIVNASGRFEATWVRGSNGEWLIHRMVTRPGK